MNRGLRSLAAGTLIATAVVVPAQHAEATTYATVTYDARGNYEWQVPAGVTSVTADVFGAKGGDADDPTLAYNAFGGFGGEVRDTIAVVPGEHLGVFVGATGTGNSSGGGRGVAVGDGEANFGGLGGAASWIAMPDRTASDDPSGLKRILVGGGGGGAGADPQWAPSCSYDVCPVYNSRGGDGGRAGQPGKSAWWDGHADPLDGVGGTGATAAAPGQGGLAGSNCFDTAWPNQPDSAGKDGHQFFGGNGGAGEIRPNHGWLGGPGGGGGGGYYGGGGGGGAAAYRDATCAGGFGGGGGGGSSYGPPGSVYNDGVRSGDGLVTLTFVKPTTTTTLVSSVNPAVPGQPITYTATVRMASGAPVASGTVDFLWTDGWCRSVPVGADGTATCSTSYPAAGSNTVAAQYGGTDVYNMSTSDPLQEDVAVGTTTTQLRPIATAPVVGQQASIVAGVAAAAPYTGIPTGSVEFSQDGAVISACASQPLDGGTAGCELAWPHAGTHKITARYLGSSDYSTSSSRVLGVRVAAAPTALVVAKPVIAATSVTVSARLTNATTGAAVPGEPVSFASTGVAICAATTDLAGTASCTGGSNAAGAVTSNGGHYQATFAGTPDYLLSSS